LEIEVREEGEDRSWRWCFVTAAARCHRSWQSSGGSSVRWDRL